MPYIVREGYSTVGAFNFATLKDRLLKYKWWILGAGVLYLGYRWYRRRPVFAR